MVEEIISNLRNLKNLIFECQPKIKPSMNKIIATIRKRYPKPELPAINNRKLKTKQIAEGDSAIISIATFFE